MPWSILTLFAFFAVFGTLTRMTPCNRGQRAFGSPEFADDALYWFLGLAFVSALGAEMTTQTLRLVFRGGAPGVLASGFGWTGHLPVVIQAGAVSVLLDFIQYWLHRLFHGRTLWPFHAIHHSAEKVDWTTTFRIHPVNFLIYSAAAVTVIRLAGFSPAAFAITAPFNLIIGPLVHANLNWTFGPFRYVVASPVFHRWHHVRDPAVHNRNFAPTFPVFDLMFGTYYMPKGVLPADYGADGVPTNFLGQLVYPFVAIAERFGLGRKVPAGEATV